jgi:2-polyprenyl-3-methyl-5-hydroxy-6-metoxy-1,4-benzoquinol methylase
MNEVPTSITAKPFVIFGDWPSSDLEVLGKCPVCLSNSRMLLFSGLRDFAFATAPGEWSIWRCRSCTAAYLDPRPTQASIARAYSRYYTHQSSVPVEHKSRATHTIKAWLGTRIMNDYKNRFYRHHLPAIPLGAIISSLWPVRRSQHDHYIRHLPGPTSANSTLLDVGCGCGDFVKVAATLGFRAVGLDPDEKAIIVARRAGLDVRVGTLPGSGLAPKSFEHITASHVLEHLHEPVQAIHELYALLQPGGRLWLTQPNLGATGLNVFGPHWRGLEPPRHLTLFDSDGMRRLLERCGFINSVLLPSQPIAGFYYRQSQCQVGGVDPYRDADPPGWSDEWERRVKRADWRARVDARVGESLTMVAWKPQ